MKKHDLKFDVEKLLPTAQALLRLSTANPLTCQQVSLTHRKIDIDNRMSLIDRMFGLGITYGYQDGIQVHHDRDFTEFAPELMHSELAKAWEQLQQLEGNLCRLRIISLPPRFCFEFHCDFTVRYHIALQTHPRCVILMGKGTQFNPEHLQAYHVPADGHVYELDGGDNIHTAMNGTSDFHRIHLIAATDIS